MRILLCPKVDLLELTFSPDGRYLAGHGRYVGKDYHGRFAGRTNSIWDVAGHSVPIQTVRDSGDGFWVSKVVFSPDGTAVWTSISQQWTATELLTGRTTQLDYLNLLRPAFVSPDGVWAACRERDEEGVVTEAMISHQCVQSVWVERWRGEVSGGESGTADSKEYMGWKGYTGDGWRFVLSSNSYSNHEFGRGRVLVIDAATGAAKHEWIGPVSFGDNPFAVGPTHQFACLDKRHAHFINLSEGNIPHVTRTNTSRKHFTAAAFSPDGRLLATTSNDTTVTMWDTATWQPVQRYGWKIGRLRAVAFAPDGLTCAAGSDTGQVVLFDMDG